MSVLTCYSAAFGDAIPGSRSGGRFEEVFPRLNFSNRPGAGDEVAETRSSISAA